MAIRPDELADAQSLTGLYRSRLSGIRATVLWAIGLIWLASYDPVEPLATLTLISGATALWIRQAQRAAQAETAAYLQATLAAASSRGDMAPVGYRDLVGTTVSGLSLEDLASQARATYLARRYADVSPELAADAAQAWLNRIAASEPYRVANQTVLDVASLDDRFTGRVVRITRPGACDFCQLIADRGYHPARAGFAAHAHCTCTAAAEISSWVPRSYVRARV